MNDCTDTVLVLFWRAVWRPLMETDCTLPSAKPILPDLEWVSEDQDQ